MKPMLAHKYRQGKITFPCLVQPKLNGIRALWLPNKGLVSRDGHIWKPEVLPHIHLSLEKINIPLDGELYAHGQSLQQINSKVAVKRVSAHPGALSISYHVFDNISLLPQEERMTWLRQKEPTFPAFLVLVPSYFVNNEVEADRIYRLFRQQRFEGMMYRSMSAPYGFSQDCGNKENRWNYLLKRKDWLDMVCRVVDVNEGEGRLQGTVGALVLMTEDGKEVKAGSGLTDQQRCQLWAIRNKISGMKVRINYEMLSDAGIPLKPTIEEVDVSV